MPRTPLWTPTPDRVANTGMDTFRRRVAATRPELVDSVALHRWSIEHQGEFHEALWDFAGVIGEPGSVAFDAGGVDHLLQDRRIRAVGANTFARRQAVAEGENHRPAVVQRVSCIWRGGGNDVLLHQG